MSAAFPGISDSPTKFYVDSGVTLEIDNDENNYYDNYGTLIHDGGLFNNRGPTVNHGNITNKSGKFKNLKSVENFSEISMDGEWVNWGLVTNHKDATITSNSKWTENANAKIDNYGTIRKYNASGKFHIASETATINVKETGRLINDNSGTMINDGNINIDKGAKLVNKDSSKEFNNWGKIVNKGTIYNYSQFMNSVLQDYYAREDSYNYGEIHNYGTIVQGNGYFGNQGHIYMYDGIIEATGGRFSNSGYITGTGTIKGQRTSYFYNEPLSTMSPGFSAGGILIEGDIYHSGKKQIEIGGPNDASRNLLDTEYDFIDVAGDLIIDGGTLEVSLIDGYKLERNQEFIISKVDGEVTGTYSGLVEGALVDKFDSIYGPGIQQNLYITYKAGDGNDIGLYTTKPVEVMTSSTGNVLDGDYIQISPEAIAQLTSENDPVIVNDALFSDVKPQNLDNNYNLPIEINTGINSETSVNIFFDLEEAREAIDQSETTKGGGTIASNAPSNFIDQITGIYFNCSAGNDAIKGSKFNDFIRSGAGNDQIDSGDGDDLIRGGAGSDKMTLGEGADIVYYTIDQIDRSIDTITDFSSEDVIQFSKGIEVLSLTDEQLILGTNLDGVMSTVTVLVSGLEVSQLVS